MEKEDILRYLLYVAIIFIICFALVFAIVRWYTKEALDNLFGTKYYEQTIFVDEEIGIVSNVLGVQDDIIVPRSLLTVFDDDYHPVKLLFSVEEGKEKEFEAYAAEYYERVEVSGYAEGICYQGQEYRKKYIYNLVSYWGEKRGEPSIGMEAYESSQGEMLYLWWDTDCDDEPLLTMPKGGGGLAKITQEQSQGRKYPLQEYND